MAYQWEVPFVIDDSRFRQTFGYGATPIERGLGQAGARAARSILTLSASS